KKVARDLDCNDRFLALFGDNGELHPALLNVDNSIARVALREDLVVGWALRNRSFQADGRKKHLGIERAPLFRFLSRLRLRAHRPPRGVTRLLAQDPVTLNNWHSRASVSGSNQLLCIWAARQQGGSSFCCRSDSKSPVTRKGWEPSALAP